MQSLYTVYFNDGSTVTPLFYMEGYTAADERFVDTARAFVRRFYPGENSGVTEAETPFIIKKYEEPAVFTAAIYADYSFKKGIVFAKKMHEAVVYEKIHYPGRIRDSYEVKCVGRIGVLCQTQAMPEQDRSYIDSLKLQIDQKDRIISQQETMIKRLEGDVARLERSAAHGTPESPKFFANPLFDFSSSSASSVPPPPPPPLSEQLRSKVNNFARRGQVSCDVLKELEEVAALTPTERRERRERDRQERERRKRKEEKRREREREEKRLVQAAENAHVLDLLIKEIDEFGVGYTQRASGDIQYTGGC